ncbi:WYL domain-containing protein [Leucobacter chromiireducens]|uniref:WYL domain-containing protein n=1 Tax=Leucobacter chromiireducens subsp. solipictus TaxID=398235 RepID=A0ABS1SFA9_9MICO|nr:WYL domain-containing protein [Leucobacter chromiireducens subsp. solipictus]
MRKPVLGPDRVLLLLSLVPYLREHGAVPVAELAERFDVTPELLRSLVRFLGTAGVPGETLSYQDEDLFDIDWDALELYDEVSLTRTVAVEEAPRFSPAETAALVAGLQAITAMLPEADAELARGIAAKLGAALGGAEPTMTVSVEPEDPRVPRLVAAIDAGQPVQFVYRDAAGATTLRRVAPIALTQRAGGWYLRAHCVDRQAERTFRVEQMSELRELDGAIPADPAPADPAPADPAPTDPAPGATPVLSAIVARVAARAVPRLAGFQPTILQEHADGSVQLRVDAWHRDTAIRLVQLAPGEIAIVSPESARDAVRMWADRALASYDA